MEFDKAKARRWIKEGDVAQALAYIQPCADAGSIDALIALADYYYDAGDRAASVDCIERAEAALRPDDWDGHVSLSSAYRLGLGAGDPPTLQRRALQHLECVGEGGNPVVQEALMLQYLQGLNGAPCHPAKARYWAEKAARQGSALAHRELKKNRSLADARPAPTPGKGG